MDHALNKEILRLSIPSILANLTVPLVGFVDTAVAGHLDGNAAAFIGAISVGAMLFNLLYWNFGFLRTGTGGLTAQAFGRVNPHDCAAILSRGLVLAQAIALLTIVLSVPFVKLTLLLVSATEEVETLACQYFLIRVLAAPATLSLMTFSGWFVGMQDSMSSMWKDLLVNGINVAASLILARGVGEWHGFGFAGIAIGTVVAQYCGMMFCILVCIFKYRHNVFSGYRIKEIRQLFNTDDLKEFFKLNANLFGRSVFFCAIYVGYTLIASTMGDLLLASSSIMMQLLLIFSYFTDGFAYAVEALTGRFIGARDKVMMRRSILYSFVWCMSVGLLFIGIYALCGYPVLRLLTDDPAVLQCCRQFLPWLLLMPPIGCAAFFWDGVFLGATASRGIRDSMIGAAAAFFAVWFGGQLISGGLEGNAAFNLLLGAYLAHLVFRAAYLTHEYPRQIGKII